MKKTVLLCCSLLFIFAARGLDLQNPALTPVKLSTPASHAPLVLLKDGKANFAIAAARSRERGIMKQRRSITRAVHVLTTAFRKCAGVEIPVFEPESAELRNYPVILSVGDNRYTRRLGIDFRQLPKEGFTVRSGRNLLVIAGYDGSLVPGTYDDLDWERYRINGTLHGAYDFIERILGCRFYFPGIGTIFPGVSDLTLQPLNYSDQPYFRNRHSHTIAVSSLPRNFYPEMGTDQWEDWEGRYRIALGTRYWAGHAPIIGGMEKEFPDKKDIIYYKDESGFVYRNPKQHIGNYFDITNLKLADLMIEALHRHYDSRGKNQIAWTNNCANADYITFGQCDTLVRNMDNATTRKLKLINPALRGSLDGELSNVHARFVFYLAEQIRKDFPGKRLSLMPYHNYVMAPTMKEYQTFPENIDLRVCIYDYPTRVPDPAINRKWLKQFKTYYKMLGNRPVSSIWLYNAPRDRFARAMSGRYLRDIPKILGKYLDRTELFWDYYGFHDWENYFNYYIMWKSQWNPDFNIDAALDEHWKLLYGAAAPQVKEFYGLVRERYEKYAALGMERTRAYPPQVLDRLEALLAKARTQVVPGSREARCLTLFARPWPRAIREMRGVLAFRKPQIRIMQTAEDSITVDGKAGEPQWQKVPAVPLTDAMGTGEQGEFPSELRLLYSSRGLYGMVTSLGRPAMNPAKSIWDNCTLEIFLSPGLNAVEYFQFAFDGAGQKFSGQKTLKPMATPFQQRENTAARSASVFNGKVWQLEFFIPWTDLKNQHPAPYRTWLGNFIISRKSPGKAYLSYSMTLGNNHDADQFGYLKFLGKGDRP